MHDPRRFFVLWIMGLLTAWPVVIGQVQAAERARDFLEGLRQRKYFDTAVQYLEQLRTSPDCPADLKETIDFEVGMTHLAEARSAPTVRVRDRAFEAAAAAVRKFIAGHPQHSSTSDANIHLADVLASQGRLQALKAEQIAEPGQGKNALLAAARAKYEEAETALEQAERSFYERAKAFQDKLLDPKTEVDKIDERDAARRDLVRSRLLLAQVTYWIGKTYPADQKAHQEQLAAAVAKYHDLYEKYMEHDASAALSARHWEGIALADLDQGDQALAVFKELLALPDDPAYRQLKIEAYASLLETCLKPKVKNYREALSQAAEWENRASDSEESSPEGLKLHLLAGRAALEYAKSLGAKDPQFRQQIAAARHHLDFLVRFPGETRREAMALLSDEAIGRPASVSQPPAATFAEAKERGNSAWDQMLIALRRLESATEPAEQTELNDQLTQARSEAMQNYRTAEALRVTDTPVEELNAIRFRLSYLYFADQDMYRAAVMGEFLARRYPQSEFARKGAEIAVKAYRNLVIDARSRAEDSSFETERMVALAQYATTVWKGEPEAEEAWMMLVDSAIDNGRLDRAAEFLAKIPADSPRRSGMDLRVGQSLWAAYARAVNQDVGLRPPQVELDKTLKMARTLLQSGIDRGRQAVEKGSPVDFLLASSVLYLAQILIDGGQPAEAVRLLDDPRIGPMTLVSAESPVTETGNFRRDTYVAALRAYVGAEQLDKAEKAMAELEALMGRAGDDGSRRRLTQIYVVLGRQLEDLLARLRNENKLDQVQQVSKSFEVFLTHIADRQQGTNFTSLNWVADTFFSLGSGLDRRTGETPAEAKRYYKRAATSYEAILKRLEQDPKFAPAGANAGVMIRLAGCLRALGEHERALKLLLSLIKEHERRVDLQVEAARIYQDWGGQQGRSAYYANAIVGSNPEGGRNLVWGWGGVAQRVASYDKLQGVFHEARYNLAVCRMKLALSKTGQEKTALLQQAELDITRVHALYPQMGGSEWFGKYDGLLKEIRKSLGEKEPKGLGE